LGEDIEYSIRIHSLGYKIGLIPDAIVYHKRRTDFVKFYKQIHFFGRARINIYKFFPVAVEVGAFFPGICHAWFRFYYCGNIWLAYSNPV
jgi:GT2 family glycosyltransferase